MNIILLGPPGTGKGTIAQFIEKTFGLRQISSGDLLREQVKEKTTIGKKVEPIMKEGKLVPDEIILKLITRKVRQLGKTGFVLDGFPRNLEQAKLLDEMLKKEKIGTDIALEISTDEEVIVKRLSARRQCRKCGKIYGIDIKPEKEGVCDNCGGELFMREDDRPEVIKYRLQLYNERTQPLIDYYLEKEKLKSIDGNMHLEEIFDGVLKLLGNK